jgi:tetratricopeptide (TPR) repeat protein
MAQIAGKYSNDPAAAQLLQGFYRDTQQYDKALRALDVVEQNLGADGTTSLWRATLYHYRGDDRQAAKLMEKATQLEPDSALAYQGLATEYVALKEYPRATATLQTLRERFGISMTLAQLEDEQGKEGAGTAILRNRWTATK